VRVLVRRLFQLTDGAPSTQIYAQGCVLSPSPGQTRTYWTQRFGALSNYTLFFSPLVFSDHTFLIASLPVIVIRAYTAHVSSTLANTFRQHP
jgi:hypothetical protein